jgi:DNA-directed RNA polymerase specialized sigma subunit
MLSKSLKPRTQRDKDIVSQLWKCDQVARKISSYSGIEFEELRDAAREYLIKIYDSWDASKANFSTWVNRCLNFYMLNYLRDKSRLIKIPRSYSDLYLKLRKVQKAHPDITEQEAAEILGVTPKKIRSVLEAFSMKFSGTAEHCYEDSNSIELDAYSSEDFGSYVSPEYSRVLINISNLDPKDESFLNDYLIKKRSHKTLMKNYPQLKSVDDIKAYSSQLIHKVLNS